jgi:histidyl-tRNA synthetase
LLFSQKYTGKDDKPMANIKPRTLSGFMELLPGPQQQMERIMAVLRETYSLYGFTPLDTPIIEDAQILLAKGGGETEKQITALKRATATWPSALT